MTLIEKVRTRDPLLFNKIASSNDCLVWTGSNHRGKGLVVRDGKRLNVRRYIFELAFDEIVPSGVPVGSKCRNRLCIKPEHMTRPHPSGLSGVLEG